MTDALAYYMDVHVPQAVTDGLCARGIDVLTAREDQHHKMPDPEVLDRASNLNRVLFTQDRDFLDITRQYQSTGQEFGPVVFMEQNRLGYGETIAELELIAQILTFAELRNKLTRLPLR